MTRLIRVQKYIAFTFLEGQLQDQADELPIAGVIAMTAESDFLLFLRGDCAQSIGEFFVNLAPMTDGVDLQNPCFSVDPVNNAKSSDFVFPQPGQLTHKRRTRKWIEAQIS